MKTHMLLVCEGRDKIISLTLSLTTKIAVVSLLIMSWSGPSASVKSFNADTQRRMFSDENITGEIPLVDKAP